MKEQTVLPARGKALYLMGDHDRLTKVRNVQARLANSNQAVLQIVEKKGHLINYECPQKVAHIVDNFIELQN